jgi:hypothetical protein
VQVVELVLEQEQDESELFGLLSSLFLLMLMGLFDNSSNHCNGNCRIVDCR